MEPALPAARAMGVAAYRLAGGQIEGCPPDAGRDLPRWPGWNRESRGAAWQVLSPEPRDQRWLPTLLLYGEGIKVKFGAYGG